jgi:hypothetical protein
MKTYIKVFIVFALVIFFSCNDEFMQRAPLDKLNDETLWATANDLELYCNSFYPEYNNGFGHGFGKKDEWGVRYDLPYIDEYSDNLATRDYKIVPAGQHITPTASGKGGWNFVNIRKLNYFLDNYQRAKINEKIKNGYAGEILFFKAWDYFNKVMKFGDVPWVTHVVETNSEVLFAPRTPRAEVMDSVLSIINQSIEWLPEKASAKDSRINKDMARFLKARIGLFEGTWRKYHNLGDGTAFLNATVEACEALMSSNNYSLYSTGDVNDDYNQLFAQTTYDGNPEAILWKEYNTSEGLGKAFSRYYTQNLEQQGCTRSLVDEYLCTDGLPIAVSPLFMGKDSIQSEFMNRDSRLQQTVANFGKRILDPSVVFYNNHPPRATLPGMGNDNRATPTGYRYVKWWLNSQEDWDAVKLGQQACLTFRYGEVLINYAEAKCELGQCTQSVLDKSLNLLRDRVGMPHLEVANVPADPMLDGYYQQYAGYVPEPLLREIRRERRIEMSLEGLRYDDLRRWKVGRFLEMPVEGFKFVQSQYPETVVGQDIHLSEEGYIRPYAQTLPNGRTFDENKHYLFPIPLEDLVLNPNLVQNPGWSTP